MEKFHVANRGCVRSVLRAVLDDAAIFLGGGNELTTFENVVREWFFDVNIFASLARPNRGQRMPMVWCGDGDGVDFFVLKSFADVFVCLWRFALGFFHFLHT